MRPKGEAARLFEALSRVAARAFADERLLSCQVLAKGQSDMLRRFLNRAQPPKPAPLLILRLALRYLAANGLHLGFMLLTALFVRLRGWKSPLNALSRREHDAPEAAAGSGPIVVIDSFAVLPRIVREGAWRDLYLPGLADAARARGYRALTLYRLYGSRNPLTLWRAVGLLAAAGPGLLEVHLLRPGDWLRLVRHLLLYPFSLLRLIRSLKKEPPDAPEHFIRQALIESAGQCVLIGEARRLAGLRLARTLDRIAEEPCPGGIQKKETLIYSVWTALLAFFEEGQDERVQPSLQKRVRALPNKKTQRFLCPFNQCFQNSDKVPEPRPHVISWYENQTVNKAFLRGLRQGKGRGSGLFCTGAQLFPWPPELLNNHADDAEEALGLVPDRVLVNGPHFLPEASRQRYSVGPSLRYTHLFTGRPGPPAATHDLLVLLSYHPEETRRVLALARELAEERSAANGAALPCELVFRFHPAARVSDYADLLPAGARFSSGSLELALASASAVMGAGSGALAEAAARGLPVLLVEADEKEGALNYLPDYGRGLLWQGLRRGREAAAALQALRQRLHEAGRDEAVADFRRLLFTEATPERIEHLLRGD